MALERRPTGISFPLPRMVTKEDSRDRTQLSKTGMLVNPALKARIDSLEQRVLRSGFSWVNPNFPDTHHVCAVVTYKDKGYLVQIDYRFESGEREIRIRDYGSDTSTQSISLVGIEEEYGGKIRTLQNFFQRNQASFIRSAASAHVDNSATHREYTSNLVVNSTLNIETRQKADRIMTSAAQIFLIQ